MPRVREPEQSVSPKRIFCSVTGMACRVETESLWANGFICATIRECDAADAELRYQRPEHALMPTLTGGSDLSRVKVPATGTQMSNSLH